MRKIVAEEIEIIVTAKVEEALKEFQKMLPEIKKQMGQVQQEFSKVDLKEIAKNIDFSKVTKQVKEANKEVQTAKENIKEAFNPNDVSGMKINNGTSKVEKALSNEQLEIKKQIQELANELEKTPKNTTAYDIIISKIHTLNRELQNLPPQVKKLNTEFSLTNMTKQQMNTGNVNNTNIDVTPSQNSMSMWDILKAKIAQIKPYIEQFKNALKGSNSSKELELLNYKISEIEEKLQGGVNGKVHLSTKEILEAEAELERLNNKKAQFEKNGKGTNIFSGMFSSLQKVMPKLNGMSGVTVKIKNQIKQMSAGMKQGIGHVLKYAGALFSLRSIYSTLSSSASSWLSSQNAGAKQLSSNIEYMKYAMGSVFAPVIQFVTNLIYNLMKAIQSVVYALFKVNIFAKASSKSYASMAGSAKKTKDETKQLLGVHDEINNIQDNKAEDGGGSGSGAVSPSFDLSKVDPSSSIMDAIANGDWYGVGVLLGQKLNEAMASIPWDSIQNTARQIGTNIANFLNGFIATTDWYQVGNTLAQGLNTAIYFAYSFITTFDWKQFGTAIGNAVNGFFDNIDWSALAQTLSEGLKGVFNIATGSFTTLDWSIIVDSIIDFFANVDYSGISDAFFEMLGSAIGSFVNFGTIIGDKLNGLIDEIANYLLTYIDTFSELGFNWAEGILFGIIDALINLGNWIIEHVFTPFIEGFKNAFGIHSPSTVMAEMGGYIIEGLKNGIVALIDTIKEIWENMKETAITKFNEVKDKLVEIWNNIKAKGQELWENIKTTITNKINNLKTNISNVLNNIKTTWTNIWTSLKTTVSNVWNGIWSTIKGVINKILGGIEGFANGIVQGINKVLSGLDGIVNAVGQVIGLDIHVSPLNEISLPRLAKGNVAYKETLAIFGEYAGASYNPEITAPRNTIKEVVEEALANQGGNNQKIELSVYVGNQKLGQILLDDLRSRKRQTGKDLEALVGG